jgi:hypothetical protein
MRKTIIGWVLLAFALMPGLALAQSASVEFNRWDAQITVQANSDQMQIAETQEVHVTGGSVSHGTRTWTSAVQVQNVYLISGSDATPRELTKNANGQSGTYNITQSGSATTLTYALPAAQTSGATFVVQINYTAVSPTKGMVDWKIVPAEHNFVVKSSTVRINFPAGQAPDASLVRASQSNAQVQVSGNQVLITSADPIAASAAFSIQVPYGAGVGAAGNTDSGGVLNPASNPGAVPPQSQPGFSGPIKLPGLGTIVAILCIGGIIIGVIVLLGGGRMLLGLVSSILGLGRGTSGGGQSGPVGGSNQGPGQRGFRSSPNQNRDTGNVGNDKDSGGGASFS